MPTKIYIGATGGPGGFDGYAGLIIGTRYEGEEKEVLVEQKQVAGQEPVPPVLTTCVSIALPNGRTALVSPEQWDNWFTK